MHVLKKYKKISTKGELGGNMATKSEKERRLVILKKAISSADKLIALQSQKLELLKQHKIGLIQLQTELEN